MTATPRPYKAVRALQNNGPDYWLIYQGRRTFGADPLAQVGDECTADFIVRAVNSYDAMREALWAVAREWERTECPLAQLGPQAPQWIQDVKAALKLAEGVQ